MQQFAFAVKMIVIKASGLCLDCRFIHRSLAGTCVTIYLRRWYYQRSNYQSPDRDPQRAERARFRQEPPTGLGLSHRIGGTNITSSSLRSRVLPCCVQAGMMSQTGGNLLLLPPCKRCILNLTPLSGMTAKARLLAYELDYSWLYRLSSSSSWTPLLGLY